MSVPPVGPVAAASAASSVAPAATKPGGATDNIFARMVKGANQQQIVADEAVQQLATGQTDNLQQVVLTAAKADLSFRLVLELRNKLIDSYQEIMRMQV